MVYWWVLYMAPKRAVWVLQAKIATEVSRPAAGTRVVTCGCSEKCGFRLPSYSDHGPRATYEPIAAHLRGRYDRWGLSQSRDGVGTPAMSVALYSAARSRPQAQPQLGAHRRVRPNR